MTKRSPISIRENFRDDKPGFDYSNAVSMLRENGFTDFAADQFLFAEDTTTAEPVETQRTSTSLGSYVAPDDVELTRKEFLFAVATRILDDLGIPHELTKIDPNAYPRD